MDRKAIYEKLTEVFQDIFDDESIAINDSTTAADIDGWDSLTHISLLSACEDEFDIHFEMKLVQGLKNVGELVDAIEGLL